MMKWEAITLLRNLEDSLDSYCELNEEGKTAFRMAIEALSCSEFPNSSDTISRQAAIDEVMRDVSCIRTHEFNAGATRAANRIKQLPPAQTDRMRGRWIPHREKSCEYIGATLVYVTYDYWFCDTCGYRVEDGQPLYNFCPNCGADMRG